MLGSFLFSASHNLATASVGVDALANPFNPKAGTAYHSPFSNCRALKTLPTHLNELTKLKTARVPSSAVIRSATARIDVLRDGVWRKANEPLAVRVVEVMSLCLGLLANLAWLSFYFAPCELRPVVLCSAAFSIYYRLGFFVFSVSDFHIIGVFHFGLKLALRSLAHGFAVRLAVTGHR